MTGLPSVLGSVGGASGSPGRGVPVGSWGWVVMAFSFVVWFVMVSPRGTRNAGAHPRSVHGTATAGYPGRMTQPLTDSTSEPDDAPEPVPFEPSVTNPDADGIDDETS
ncbi:MAG: hypothetical protein ABW075_08615 [Aeromicrobium sp.]